MNIEQIFTKLILIRRNKYLIKIFKMRTYERKVEVVITMVANTNMVIFNAECIPDCILT